MKKIYSKPQIVFDSFELSQSIAAGCKQICNHAWEQCAVDIGKGKTIFLDGSVCNTTAPGLQNKLCYDVPAPDNKLFSS